MISAGQQRQVQIVTAMLLALVLVTRILVPPGWMPAAEGGLFRISLCTAWGPVAAPIDHKGQVHHQLHGKQGHSGPDGAKDPPCTFAGLASAWLIEPPTPISAQPLLQPPSVSLTSLVLAVGRGLAAPPPPATGPPARL
jgi:hypothetical protein